MCLYAPRPLGYRYAIVKYVINHIDRIAMGRRTASGHTAALSMATSTITLPGFISRKSPCSISRGARAPGIRTAPINRSVSGSFWWMMSLSLKKDFHVGRHDVVKIAKPLHVDVENRNAGLKAGGDFRSIGPHHPAPENGHLRWLNSGHAAQ